MSKSGAQDRGFLGPRISIQVHGKANWREEWILSRGSGNQKCLDSKQSSSTFLKSYGKSLLKDNRCAVGVNSPSPSCRPGSSFLLPTSLCWLNAPSCSSWEIIYVLKELSQYHSECEMICFQYELVNVLCSRCEYSRLVIEST